MNIADQDCQTPWLHPSQTSDTLTWNRHIPYEKTNEMHVLDCLAFD